VYAYATMGELVAFVIGWALTLEYAFGASTVAVSWSGYVVSLLYDFGVQIPAELTNAAGTRLVDLTQGTIAQTLQVKAAWMPMTDGLLKTAQSANVSLDSLPQTTAILNLPAVIIILLLTGVLYRGISESAKINNGIVLLKTIVILVFIGAGIWFVSQDNFTPFIPENTGKFGDLGWSGILAGAGTIFFAYIGFDAVSTAAQETKNPEKNMPIGILYGDLHPGRVRAHWLGALHAPWCA
jgi:basic amino acid/polyamine antiporter, APA family